MIGNGNVAVDVARILLKSPSELSHTDISEEALAALEESAVRRVALVGRRGPVQAAFTTSELRELLSLGGGNPVAKPANASGASATGAKGGKGTSSSTMPPLSSPLEDSSSSIELIMRDAAVEKKQTVIKSLPDRVFLSTDADEEELKERPVFRKFDLLKRLLSIEPPKAEALEGPGAPKSLELFFLRSPVAFLEDPNRPGHVGAVKFEHNILSGDAGNQHAQGMGFFFGNACFARFHFHRLLCQTHARNTIRR